jgi:hypothetical protein
MTGDGRKVMEENRMYRIKNPMYPDALSDNHWNSMVH